MKKILLVAALFAALFAALSSAQAQKFTTRNGHIDFFAKAVSDISAENNSTVAIIDAGSGQIAFKVLINGFQFEKSLMQTHFNEDMESKEFPDATFEGTLSGFSASDLSTDGPNDASVSGNLKVHGITRPVTVPCKIIVKGGKITGAKATFKVLLKDYDIKARSGVPGEININVDISNFAQM
jgi:polyisoprenoid-binding protein YceI